MPDLLDLRLATADDQPFLFNLYRSTRDDLACLGDNPAIASLIALQQQIQDNGHRTHYPDARHWLLWRDDQPVARLVLDEDSQRLHIVDIAVLDNLRSQGLGSALLRWARQQARAVNLPLELRVQRHNERARRLYETLGFQTVASDDVSNLMRWQE